MSGKL